MFAICLFLNFSAEFIRHENKTVLISSIPVTSMEENQKIVNSEMSDLVQNFAKREQIARGKFVFLQYFAGHGAERHDNRFRGMRLFVVRLVSFEKVNCVL